jgi:hypothetical protein
MHAQDESTRARAFDPAYAARLPGFAQTERIDRDAFTLIRLEARVPRPLDTAALADVRLGSGSSAVLLER